MPDKRVLVYGGRGGLGSVIVSRFKASGWWVASVDLAANEEADANGEIFFFLESELP